MQRAFRTALLRPQLIALATCLVTGIAGCSFPEEAAVPHDGTRPGARASERDERTLERRRRELQARLLRDLKRLRERLDGPTETADQASDGAAEAKNRLLIFGGASHEVYLGCLCEEQNPESVFKLTGEYGSDLSTTSLRNKFAPYGSNYEDTSACNPKATHPPSVLAPDGKALGLLTVNTSLKKRIAAPSVVDWLARMCSL